MKKTTIIRNKASVSAIIGVILMVAITVAIAATVYVYVSGMMGDTHEDIVNKQIQVDNNYTIMDTTFKNIWNVRGYQRIEFVIMDFQNGSLIIVCGFLFNTDNHILRYDNNSDLIKLI